MKETAPVGVSFPPDDTSCTVAVQTEGEFSCTVLGAQTTVVVVGRKIVKFAVAVRCPVPELSTAVTAYEPAVSAGTENAQLNAPELSELHVLGVVATVELLNFSVIVCETRKPEPLTATDVPAGPPVGNNVIAGTTTTNVLVAGGPVPSSADTE